MLLLLISLYVSSVRSAPLSSIFLAPVVLEDDITGVLATRTLWNIVYTCFTTTFAITWISMHPNIPNKRHPLYPVFLRLLLATYALLIPEAIVFWAAVQWKSAHECTAHFKKKGSGYETWTLTHSFFLLMGGFTLDCETAKHGYRVIPVHEFKKLVDREEIIFPTIEEEDLKDKSKGDPLAKGFVILQTLWFVIQILARFAQNLVVTELEVITFALVPLNIGTYYFWMHKPLSVKRPIRLARNPNYVSLKRATSPTSPLSPPLDSAIGASPYQSTPEVHISPPETTTPAKSPSLHSKKGRFETLLSRFLRMVNFWADEADEMLKPVQQRSSSPDSMTAVDQLNAPSNAPKDSPFGQEETKRPAKWSFKAFADLVTRVVTFARKHINNFRGNSRKLSTTSEGGSSSIAFQSIIGSIIAIIVVIFLAVFAILSISPLLFVALGFLCLAILTAPWVATRAFHAIGTEPNTKTKKEGPTLLIFYAPKMDKRSSNIMLGVTVVGATIFGGLHVLAWQFRFPTPVEHLLWRISSLALTALPALYFGCHLLTEYVFPDDEEEIKIKNKNRGGEEDKSKSEQEGEDGKNKKSEGKNKNDSKKKINGCARNFIRFWILLGIPAYTLARLYVLAEAVVALRDPKPGTLSAVTWSKFIPHF